jgi:hypothetical protein
MPQPFREHYQGPELCGTSENAQTANFVEFYKGEVRSEVRRIPIPRTPVNKGMNKAHSPLGCYLYAAPPFSACFLLVSEELRELRMQTCEEALRDGRSEFICRTKAD